MRWKQSCCIAKKLSFEEESYEEDIVICENHHDNHDYRVKVDIMLFYRTMGVEEFLDWKIVIDRFFDVMGVPENKQVKMLTIRLKSNVVVWWDKLVVHMQRQRNWPISTWRMNEAFDVRAIFTRGL